jgi:hypothetical protein
MTTPAGWYDDGSGRQRWFDGQAWTDDYMPGSDSTNASQVGSSASDQQASLPPDGPSRPPAKGLAVGALVTGIIAFLSGWAPVWGIIAGGAAIVLGLLALRAHQSKGMGITGISLGALALLTSVLTTAAMATPHTALPAPTAAPATSATPSSEPMFTPEPTPSPEPTAAPSTEASQTPEAQTPETFTMPNLVGKNLQAAQEQLQALGSSVLDQKDASGQGRTQVVDSNWKVCEQEPAAGQQVPTTTTVVLSSVKSDEYCPGEAPKAAGIGDAVRVGDLTVTVKSAERKSKLSSVFGSKKGHWMLVTVKVANKGKDQVTVNDSNFTLTEPDGTTYSTDSDGMTYIDSDDWLFLKKINPKTSATGKVLFAIPKSAKNLTLHISTGFLGSETADISLGSK